jgi:hypothetical protein
MGGGANARVDVPKLTRRMDTWEVRRGCARKKWRGWARLSWEAKVKFIKKNDLISLNSRSRAKMPGQNSHTI